jgi:hypothetical protein
MAGAFLDFHCDPLERLAGHFAAITCRHAVAEAGGL